MYALCNMHIAYQLFNSPHHIMSLICISEIFKQLEVVFSVQNNLVKSCVCIVNSQTHSNTQHTLISDSFGVVKSCSVRGEGRRDLEEGLRYGVKMNHMITLGSCEFIFLF